MAEKNVESICPRSGKDWRDWLQANHNTKQSVWVIFYKKETGKPSLSWSEAVDEALCFGWIDSTKRSIDSERYMQLFTKRKASSTWSKINKDKVAELTAAGKMTEAGMKSVELAKANGSWTILDMVETLHVPDDLEKAFQQNDGARSFYEQLPKSKKKGLLYWIVSAKRDDTRQKRINEIAEKAAQNSLPKQFQA